jgi:hypothetical protein
VWVTIYTIDCSEALSSHTDNVLYLNELRLTDSILPLLVALLNTVFGHQLSKLATRSDIKPAAYQPVKQVILDNQ